MSILGIIIILLIIIIGYWLYKSIQIDRNADFYLKSAIYSFCTTIVGTLFLFLLTWVTIINDLTTTPLYDIQSEEYELISFGDKNYYLNISKTDGIENISFIRNDNGRNKFETYCIEDKTLTILINTIKPYYNEKARVIIYKRAKLNIRMPQKLFMKKKNWRKRQLHYDIYKIEFRIPENGINKSL